MKRIGDIMKDLGFKEGAPEGVQKAFIKNAIREAYGAEVKNLSDYRPQKSTKPEKKIAVGQQLSFDIEDKD